VIAFTLFFIFKFSEKTAISNDSSEAGEVKTLLGLPSEATLIRIVRDSTFWGRDIRWNIKAIVPPKSVEEFLVQFGTEEVEGMERVSEGTLAEWKQELTLLDSGNENLSLSDVKVSDARYQSLGNSRCRGFMLLCKSSGAVWIKWLEKEREREGGAPRSLAKGEDEMT